MELMFANAWMLYLLWLVPLMLAALIAALKRRENRIAAFVAPVMQKRLRPRSDLSRQIWQSIVLAAGLLFCMIALARPQWGKSEQQVFRKGRDIVIALDVSRSMLADDVHPNRLERAKIDVMDLLNDIEGDRTALVAFRHKAVALCPLTTDYAFLRHILDMAGLHSAPRGETDIGAAIDYSIEMLAEDDSAHKAILLISDGEDLEGNALDAAKRAAARSIAVFTVGFGRASGSTIPASESGSLLKYKGKEVISSLNNEVLYDIARITGGAYVPIQTASTAQTTLGDIYEDHFSRIAAREMEETITSRYSERFHYFLLPGIMLLLAAAFMSKGRLAGTTQDKPSDDSLKDLNPDTGRIKPLAVAVILLLPVLSLAATNSAGYVESDLPEGRTAAREAQQLHEQGKYADASELYLRAARTISGSAKEAFTYNAAVSLYEAGKYSEAIDLLETISGEGSIPRDKLDMALGTIYHQTAEDTSETNKVKRLEQTASSLKNAAEHFAQAARLNTDHQEDAVKNAAAIIERLPEAKKKAHEAALLQQYADSDAFKVLDRMLSSQRTIMKDSAEAYTADDPSQVRLLEDLAERQKDNADMWIPLKQKLGQAAQASTNRTSIEALEKIADETKARMLQSAMNMKDLDSSGYHDAAVSEDSVYRIWKGAAPPSSLIEEDLRRQSNSLHNTDSPQMQMRDQKEGIELTDRFRDRFEKAFPENAPPPQQGSSEEDVMTPEKRAQILDLSELTKKTQEKALTHLKNNNTEQAKARQRAALANLQEIQSLLPKQKQDQQKKQNQQQQDQQKNEDREKQKEPQEEPDQQPDQKQEQEPGQGDEDREKEEKPQEEKQLDEEMSESEVQRLLDKALQREKQHEIEKKKEAEFVPSKMIDRDW